MNNTQLQRGKEIEKQRNEIKSFIEYFPIKGSDEYKLTLERMYVKLKRKDETNNYITIVQETNLVYNCPECLQSIFQQKIIELLEEMQNEGMIIVKELELEFLKL